MKVALLKKGVKGMKGVYAKVGEIGKVKMPKQKRVPGKELMLYKPKRTKWGQAKKDFGIFGKTPTGKAIKKYGEPTLIAGTGFELGKMYSDNKNNKALKSGKKSIVASTSHSHGPFGQIKKY